MIEHTTAGKMSLAELADGHKSQPSTILRPPQSTVPVVLPSQRRRLH
jgi:hypothetical protein